MAKQLWLKMVLCLALLCMAGSAWAREKGLGEICSISAELKESECASGFECRLAPDSKAESDVGTCQKRTSKTDSSIQEQSRFLYERCATAGKDGESECEEYFKLTGLRHPNHRALARLACEEGLASTPVVFAGCDRYKAITGQYYPKDARGMNCPDGQVAETKEKQNADGAKQTTVVCKDASHPPTPNGGTNFITDQSRLTLLERNRSVLVKLSAGYTHNLTPGYARPFLPGRINLQLGLLVRTPSAIQVEGSIGANMLGADGELSEGKEGVWGGNVNIGARLKLCNLGNDTFHCALALGWYLEGDFKSLQIAWKSGDRAFYRPEYQTGFEFGLPIGFGRFFIDPRLRIGGGNTHPTNRIILPSDSARVALMVMAGVVL
jgi:hypothetical protein